MERDIGELKGYVAMLLSDLIKEREAKNLIPLSVGMADFQNAIIGDVKKILNELCMEQILTFHRTLNDVSFEFTPPK